MKGRVEVIAAPAVCLGLRLAGLHAHPADSVASASKLLDRLTREGESGVILVQEELAAGWDRGAGARQDSALPIVVPFPGPSEAPTTGAAAAYVAEILRQAVGYRVRLR